MTTNFVTAYGEEMTHAQMTQQLMKRVSDLEKHVKENYTLIAALSDRINYMEQENID